MRLIATLIVLTLFSLSVSQEFKTVKLGMSITSTMHPGIRLPPDTIERLISMASTTIQGVKIFEDYVNENCPYNIGGDNVCFEIVIYNDDYTGPNITQNYIDLIEKEEIDFLVTGFGTSPSNYAAAVTEERGKLIVSTTTTSSLFHEGRKYAFSVYPTTLSMGIAAIPHYRIAGVKSVTFIKTINSILPASRETCTGFEDELIKSNIRNFSYVYYDYNTTFEEAQANYTEVANEVIAIDNDLVIFCGIDGLVLMEISKRFMEKDYAPKGAYSTTVDYLLDREIANFWVMGSGILATEFSPPEGRFLKTEDEYIKRLKNLYPDYEFKGIDHKLGFYGALAFETILAGMIAADSVDDVVAVADAIRRNTHTSFIGDISYDAQNRITYPGVIVQYTYDNHNALAPYTISNESLIYPIPEWKERQPRTKYSAIEIVVMVFAALSILNSIGWMVYVVYNRQRKEIAANSPIFLGSLLVGSILVYISIFFWTPTHKSSVGCNLQVAFLLFGFLLLFGSLVVKTWRVHLLFSQRTLKVFHISNIQVFLFLSILLMIDIVLYIIWAVLTKSKLVLQPNTYIPYEEYYYCSTNTGGQVMIWIMVGYHGLIFIYGAYLALRVRTIPFKLYDESKIIAFCIYNVGLVAIIVAILEATEAAERYVQFGLRSFLIILSLGITINAMFVAKVTISKNVNHSSSTDSASMSNIRSTNSSTTSSFQSVQNNDWERLYKKLKRENKKLKDQIKQLKRSGEKTEDE